MKNALNVVDMEPLVVPTRGHRLRGEALESAVAAEEDPERVVAVVVTSGTTNAGIIDDLAGIGSVAQARNLWFRVDGAYGGAALFSELVRERFAGVELSDSLVVDPHKWLFAPFDCAGLIYRHPHLAKAVHTQDAAYLEALHTDAPIEWKQIGFVSPSRWEGETVARFAFLHPDTSDEILTALAA